MNNPTSTPRLFYGWWMVLICCIAMAAGPILITGTFSIFVKPLAEEFGWSRGSISLAFSIVAFMIAFFAPILGILIDRFGPRKVILTGAVVFGGGFCSFWFLSASLWHLYACYLVTAFGGACLTSLPFASIISRWFTRQRGLALGLMGVGVFLGGMYGPPLVTAIITTVGWRWAYVTLGLIIWVVAIPIAGFLLIDTPQQKGLQPLGEHEGGRETAPASHASHSTQGPNLTLAEARKTTAFWCMAVSFSLLSAVSHACITHFAPLLTDQGLSPQQAASALMLLSAMGVLGRVIAGYLVDRLPAHLVAGGLFLGVVIGLLAAFGADDITLAFVFAAMVGLGFGAETDLMPYLIAHHFGLASFGRIFGWLYGAFAFGGMLGPLLMGKVFDATGSYDIALTILIPTTIVSAGLMLPLGWKREGIHIEAAKAVGH
ncbi:MAG: MFS transporter [Deltaproteobacteria bacterium]|nr:MFS transporter [Deltaproteobacteria bacterium]